MIIACSPDVAAVRRRDGWVGGRDRFFCDGRQVCTQLFFDGTTTNYQADEALKERFAVLLLQDEDVVTQGQFENFLFLLVRRLVDWFSGNVRYVHDHPSTDDLGRDLVLFLSLFCGTCVQDCRVLRLAFGDSIIGFSGRDWRRLHTKWQEAGVCARNFVRIITDENGWISGGVDVSYLRGPVHRIWDKLHMDGLGNRSGAGRFEFCGEEADVGNDRVAILNEYVHDLDAGLLQVWYQDFAMRGRHRLSGMIGHDNQLFEAFDTLVGVDGGNGRLCFIANDDVAQYAPRVWYFCDDTTFEVVHQIGVGRVEASSGEVLGRGDGRMVVDVPSGAIVSGDFEEFIVGGSGGESGNEGDQRNGERNFPEYDPFGVYDPDDPMSIWRLLTQVNDEGFVWPESEEESSDSPDVDSARDLGDEFEGALSGVSLDDTF